MLIKPAKEPEVARREESRDQGRLSYSPEEHLKIKGEEADLSGQ